MKILHVVNDLSPGSGGPTTVLMGLAGQQSAAGLDVSICTTDSVRKGDDPAAARDVIRSLEDRGVTVHRFPVDFRPLLFSRAMARWLHHELAGHDILDVHGLYRFPPTYSAYCARRLGVPYVIRPHGSLDPFLFRQSSISLPLKRLWERLFDLPNLRAAGGVHYTTEEERDRVAFLKLQAPAFVGPYGLDWERFEGLPPRGAFRAMNGIGDAPLILFLGRVNFKKGLDLLIPAFSQVRQHHPGSILTIVGPDNEGYGTQVRRWIREAGLDDSVRLLSPAYGRAVLEAYVDADVFALPSYTENFGMTVVEAMACGLPVVISDQVNIHREVSASGAGLVTPCEAAAVAAAIQTLLADSARREAMGIAGRAACRELYSWPRIVERMQDDYEVAIRLTRERRSAIAQRSPRVNE
jgi:glycosyltransferase involved in cell wall biosynthesis